MIDRKRDESRGKPEMDLVLRGETGFQLGRFPWLDFWIVVGKSEVGFLPGILEPEPEEIGLRSSLRGITEGGAERIWDL